MILYYLIIIVLLVCAIYYDLGEHTKNRDIWVNLTLVILVCLAGFRYRMGTDSLAYEDEFITFPKIWELNIRYFQESRYAPLYILSNSLLRSITSSFTIVQFAFAIFLNLSIFKAINRYGLSKYIFTILLFYFTNLYYNLNFECLRESVAVGIFLFSVDDLIQRDYKKYFIKIIIAIGFHFGAVFFLLAPLLRNIRINKTFVIIACCSIPLFPLIKQIPLVEWVISYASFSLTEEYILTYAANLDSIEGAISIKVIFLHLILPLACCIFLKRINNVFVKYDFLIIMFMLIRWIATFFIPMMIRYSDYLGIFYYSLISISIIEGVKHYGKKSVVLYLLVLMPFAVTTYNSWAKAYVIKSMSDAKRIELIKPYTSVFDKRKIPQREALYFDLYRGMY